MSFSSSPFLGALLYMIFTAFANDAFRDYNCLGKCLGKRNLKFQHNLESLNSVIGTVILEIPKAAKTVSMTLLL